MRNALQRAQKVLAIMLNNQSPPDRLARVRAFTLVELLVVIAIIGILVALLPNKQSSKVTGL